MEDNGGLPPQLEAEQALELMWNEAKSEIEGINPRKSILLSVEFACGYRLMSLFDGMASRYIWVHIHCCIGVHSSSGNHTVGYKPAYSAGWNSAFAEVKRERQELSRKPCVTVDIGPRFGSLVRDGDPRNSSSYPSMQKRRTGRFRVFRSLGLRKS